MKVSIITPCFNSSQFISEMIESVISQSYTDWELIVVDDCSTDNTVDIVENYVRSDNRIKLVQHDVNVGAAASRNDAISIASGRYIAFLDSDDSWVPNKLDMQISFMEESNVPLVFCSYDRVDVDGNYKGTIEAPERLSYHDLLRSCPIGCLTVIYDTFFFGKMFMPDIRKRQDYCLWLKLLKLTDFAYGQNLVLAKYRVHNQSISSNKFSAARYQWKVYQEIERLPLAKSIFYFCCYAFNGFLKIDFRTYFRRFIF